MTKEEAKKMLTNTKVYVNGKSKEIQEKLFKIGFSWIGDTLVNKEHFPFIYLNDDFYLRADKDMTFFKEYHFREVSAEDILNIKIDEEFNLKDGDIFCYADTFGNHWISIFNRLKEPKYVTHLDLCTETCNLFSSGVHGFNITNFRFATKEEKEKLFFALKKQGLFWNEGTKQVESIKKEHKFKPFDRVLVRYEEDENWRINLYGKKDTGMDAPYPYKCIWGDWSLCIPYEGNESLLGTNNSPKE